MTPVQQKYFDAYQRLRNYSAVAREFGVNESTVRQAIKTAQMFMDADDAIKFAMASAGMRDIGALHSGWIKNETASLYFKAPQDDVAESFIDRIKYEFVGIKPIEPIDPPEHVLSELLTVYPLADAHIGMLAWGAETGEDYNTKIACDRLRYWIGKAVASAPASHTAVILDVGDLTHADDQKNMTPRSGHILDVDTRHYRTLEATIAALAAAAELAAQKHREVIIRILPGNHNPQAYMAVMFALAERYRDNPRISVEKNPSEFFVMQWGKVMLCAHHGDKAKAERLVLNMADVHPEIWGKTTHRYLFTGHLHHHKSADIGGVQWEQLRALTAKDAYAVSHAYSARSQLQAITYDKERGEVMRVKIGSF